VVRTGLIEPKKEHERCYVILIYINMLRAYNEDRALPSIVAVITSIRIRMGVRQRMHDRQRAMRQRGLDAGACC